MRNEYEVIDNVAYVKINNNYLGEVIFKVDADDLDLIKEYNWRLKDKTRLPNKYIHYYVASSQGFTLHRYILDAPDGLVVDHINGDRMDNRRVNLRICTVADNTKNIGLRKDNNTGFRGICRKERHYKDGKRSELFYRATVGSKSKSFSIYKFGEEGALRKAIDYRDKKLRELNYVRRLYKNKDRYKRLRKLFK